MPQTMSEWYFWRYNRMDRSRCLAAWAVFAWVTLMANYFPLMPKQRFCGHETYPFALHFDDNKCMRGCQVHKQGNAAAQEIYELPHSNGHAASQHALPRCFQQAKISALITLRFISNTLQGHRRFLIVKLDCPICYKYFVNGLVGAQADEFILQISVP